LVAACAVTREAAH